MPASAYGPAPSTGAVAVPVEYTFAVNVPPVQTLSTVAPACDENGTATWHVDGNTAPFADANSCTPTSAAPLPIGASATRKRSPGTASTVIVCESAVPGIAVAVNSTSSRLLR